MEQARKERVRKPDGVRDHVIRIPKIPVRQGVNARDPVRVPVRDPVEAPVKVVEKVAEGAAGINFTDQTTYRKEAIPCQDLTEQAPWVPGP